MNNPKPIHSTITVKTPGRAVAIMGRLVERSQWFEFTTIPDDRYEIKVKIENDGLLRDTVRDIETWSLGVTLE